MVVNDLPMLEARASEAKITRAAHGKLSETSTYTLDTYISVDEKLHIDQLEFNSMSSRKHAII